MAAGEHVLKHAAQDNNVIHVIILRLFAAELVPGINPVFKTAIYNPAPIMRQLLFS
jgi:hypothetical protein